MESFALVEWLVGSGDRRRVPDIHRSRPGRNHMLVSGLPPSKRPLLLQAANLVPTTLQVTANLIHGLCPTTANYQIIVTTSNRHAFFIVRIDSV
jgi:hypothetical protein